MNDFSTPDYETVLLLEEKVKRGEDFTVPELRFLYELDKPIIWPQSDEIDTGKVEVLKNLRNQKKDLALLLSCSEEEIALTEKEAMSGNIRYYTGGIDFTDFSVDKKLVLPREVWGHVSLLHIREATNIVFPEKIGGNLYLLNLRNTENLELPRAVHGKVYLDSLTPIEREFLRKKYPALTIAAPFGMQY